MMCPEETILGQIPVFKIMSPVKTRTQQISPDIVSGKLTPDESIKEQISPDTTIIWKMSQDEIIEKISPDKTVNGKISPDKNIKQDRSPNKTIKDLNSPEGSEKPFSCDTCHKTFADKNQLRAHIRVHTKPFACSICPKSFSWQKLLNTHIKNKHFGIKEFSCDKCPQTFTRKCSLVNHKRGVHTNDRPYSCSSCDKSFPEKGQLTAHERHIHLNTRPFKCDECGKAYFRTSELNRHKKGHSKFKPFQCAYCVKSFHHKWHLTQHSSRCTANKENSNVGSIKQSPTIEEADNGYLNIEPSDDTIEDPLCVNDENWPPTICESPVDEFEPDTPTHNQLFETDDHFEERMPRVIYAIPVNQSEKAATDSNIETVSTNQVLVSKTAKISQKRDEKGKFISPYPATTESPKRGQKISTITRSPRTPKSSQGSPLVRESPKRVAKVATPTQSTATKSPKRKDVVQRTRESQGGVHDKDSTNSVQNISESQKPRRKKVALNATNAKNWSEIMKEVKCEQFLPLITHKNMMAYIEKSCENYVNNLQT